jgi:hypothetical protein
MTSFTIDYDTYKVTTSLNAETIFISMMNINTYAIYEKEITIMDFNNDKFTLTNLYNIFQKGFNIDKNIKIIIELHNKILKINFKILSDLMNFEHSFQLQEKYDDNIHMKELKKELNELKPQVKNIINKNTKTNSIIPIINLQINEDEVETKYKWFLDWFLTLIEKNPTIDKLNMPNNFPNSPTGIINGRPIADLNPTTLYIGWNANQGISISYNIPEKSLYYYLKRRNISMWCENNVVRWMYT